MSGVLSVACLTMFSVLQLLFSRTSLGRPTGLEHVAPAMPFRLHHWEPPGHIGCHGGGVGNINVLHERIRGPTGEFGL